MDNLIAGATYGSETLEIQIHLRNTNLGAIALMPLRINWRYHYEDNEWYAWVKGYPHMFKSYTKQLAIDALIEHLQLEIKQRTSGAPEGEHGEAR